MFFEGERSNAERLKYSRGFPSPLSFFKMKMFKGGMSLKKFELQWFCCLKKAECHIGSPKRIICYYINYVYAAFLPMEGDSRLLTTWLLLSSPDLFLQFIAGSFNPIPTLLLSHLLAFSFYQHLGYFWAEPDTEDKKWAVARKHIPLPLVKQSVCSARRQGQG